MLNNILKILKDGLYNILVLGPRTLFFKKLFPVWQGLGFYLIPNHFYEPIPDTRTLSDKIWTEQLTLNSINFFIKDQFKLLGTITKKFKKEYLEFPLNPTNDHFQYYVNNSSFGSVDGEILYCIIRYFKPKKIIEIGSGFSSLLAESGLKKNKQYGQNSKFTIIDPYPSENIRSNFPRKFSLIKKRVQDVHPSQFLELENNDILFIDSTHVLKIGSDLHFLFLKILPILKKGVIVHFHDIFLPKEYPKDHVLKRYYFYNEQYFLYTFLLFNNSFKVLLASSYLNSNYRKILTKYFPSLTRKKSNPASFWIQKIR